MRNGGGRTEPRRANPQGLTGTPPRRGQRKGGDQTGEEAAETGSRREAAGADRDLGSRSRAARQRAQRRWWRPVGVDPCPGGQVVQDRKRGENRVQRAVQLRLMVADGEGVGTQWMAWKIQKTVETVVWG